MKSDKPQDDQPLPNHDDVLRRMLNTPPMPHKNTPKQRPKRAATRKKPAK